MALKVNVLKQKVLDAKAALNALLSQQSDAKSRVSALLGTQMEAGTTGTDESKKAVGDVRMAAKALDEQVAAARDLLQAHEEALHAEQTRIAEEDSDLQRNPSGRIDVGKDHSEDKPWGEGHRGLGLWAMAVKRAQLGQGFDSRLAAGMSREQYQAAASGMGESFGPDGGFAVPMEYASGIEREMFTVGDILSRVDARDISGNAITYNVMKETGRTDGSRQGGVLGYWLDEGEAPDATKFQLAKIEMKLRKVGCLGYLTEELEQDAPALGQELERAFTDELIFQVENKVYRGSGAGSPLGFLGAPCLVTVAKETGQAGGTILTKNLSKMWARMPARSKANSAWLINVDCEPQLDELSIPAGTAALEPRFVTYGPDGLLRIKGRPVIAVEYAESVGTKGDIALVDLSRYRLIRKGGVQQASSIHVRFAQGESTYRGIYRVDGQPVPRTALTPFKGTGTLSPFVVLDDRA